MQLSMIYCQVLPLKFELNQFKCRPQGMIRIYDIPDNTFESEGEDDDDDEEADDEEDDQEQNEGKGG